MRVSAEELFACWSLVGQLDVVHARLMSVSSQHMSAASHACHVQGCIAQKYIAIAELAYYAVYRGLLLMVLWCASLVLVPSMLTTVFYLCYAIFCCQLVLKSFHQVWKTSARPILIQTVIPS